MRRLVMITGGVVAGWLVLLVIVGFTCAGRTGRNVATRVSDSLQATGSIGETDLALVRGSLELERLHVVRDDSVGKLRLDVDEVTCDLPPLGLAIADRECRALELRGLDLEVSTFALFKLQKPKRPPIRARRVVIERATLAFASTAVVRGLGRIAITIEHAEAGPTVFKTPVSWLFALRELRATIALPADIVVQLTYANGLLTASGTLFGRHPITVAAAPPALDENDDAHAQIAKLVTFGVDVAERLVTRRVKDWLRSKLL